MSEPVPGAPSARESAPAPAQRALLGARALAALVMLLGGGVLAPWWQARSAGALPDAMKLNSALCFLWAGGSLLLLSLPQPLARRLGRGLGAALGAWAAASLSQDLFGWNLGLDDGLFAARADAAAGEGGAAAGRMSALTALCFALCGLGLAAQRGNPWRGGAYAAIAAALVALAAVFGHLLDVQSLHQLKPYAGMTLQTALGVTLLAVGVLLVRLEAGWLMRLSQFATVTAVAALLAIGWTVSYRLGALSEEDQQEMHARQVQLELEQFSAALLNAESSQRGYVITGNEQHLALYAQAVKAARAELASALRLTADSPAQQALLAILEKDFQAKLAGMDRTIRLRRAQGLKAARDSIEQIWDQGHMARIRQTLAAAEMEEQRLLERHAAAKTANAAHMVQTLAGAGALALLALLAVVAFLWREAARRQASDAALAAHRAHLRDVVSMYTVELAHSEARQRLLVEHAPVALAMFDARLCYLAASRRWRAELGLAETNVIGRSHCELFPAMAARSRELHQRVLAGEVFSAEAERFVRPDGSVRWLRWEARPWRDEQGVVRGSVVFAADTGPREDAAAAPREREAAAQA